MRIKDMKEDDLEALRVFVRATADRAIVEYIESMPDDFKARTRFAELRERVGSLERRLIDRDKEREMLTKDNASLRGRIVALSAVNGTLQNTCESYRKLLLRCKPLIGEMTYTVESGAVWDYLKDIS